MWASSLRFAALALLPTTAFGAQVVFNLDIVNTQLAPDGFVRDTVVPNGTFPGPTIKVQKGDSVVIHTHNKLTSPEMRRSTSIARILPSADLGNGRALVSNQNETFAALSEYILSPRFVNQCPIAPSTTFDYVFDTAGQTGNYWYHSHLSTQYCDGLRGAFVVYDPNDPLAHLYDVDDGEFDHYHLGRMVPLVLHPTRPKTAQDTDQHRLSIDSVAPQVQNTFFKTNIIPIPDSGLINGKGRYVNGTAGPTNVPYAVITVKQGLRYRFRVFSLSCRPYMTLSFDNHTFDVMELDGVEHDPMPFQRADIYAAQRISLILNANQSVDNYWIRAPPTGGNAKSNPNFDASLTRAILRYVGAPEVEPTTVDVPGAKLDDSLMHPIASEVPGNLGSKPADKTIVLNISQPNAPFFDINGISYLSPSLPVLLLPPNSIVDITIPGAGDHPFHLHGHNFDVILGTNATVPNFVNPPRRDVINISGGNTTFRFFTNNPGAWFLHCHIDWHLEAGLAVVFGESPSDNISGPKSQIQTPQWKELCPTYDDLAPEFQ
ncbi:putative Laccase-1 [Mycena venus]|uniref:Putative Laccase-1 n=1 Tax=Mycena venus TaxID=2733690 RepID=A0A8H6XK10_9AGAR|nr:putative Laccase-1 [Mycena venus]